MEKYRVKTAGNYPGPDGQRPYEAGETLELDAVSARAYGDTLEPVTAAPRRTLRILKGSYLQDGKEFRVGDTIQLTDADVEAFGAECFEPLGATPPPPPPPPAPADDD